ncbi:MAG: hypothetical protein ABIG31_02540 [Candidatus Omnitrophota bacterium]
MKKILGFVLTPKTHLQTAISKALVGMQQKITNWQMATVNL